MKNNQMMINEKFKYFLTWTLPQLENYCIENKFFC